MNKKAFFTSSLVFKFTLLLLSILGSLVFIELGLRLAGQITLQQQERKNRIALQHKGNFRILCLGESTTALGGKDSYPAQLEKILNTANLGINFNVINKGIPSINTCYILAQIENNLATYQPNVVILMVGINDPPEQISEITQSFTPDNSFFKSLRLYKLYRLMRFYLKEEFAKEKQTIKTPTNSQIEIAWQARNNKKFAQAEAAFYNELKTNPKNSQAYIGLAYTYIDEEKFLEAKMILQKGISFCPNEPALYAASGFLDKKNDNFLEAETNFKKSLLLNPNQDALYLALGSLYHQQHKYNLAENAFKKSLELNPKNIDARNALAWCLFEQNKLKTANNYFKKPTTDILNKDLFLEETPRLNPESDKNWANSQYLITPTIKNTEYNPITADNLIKINIILMQHNLRFFCMQYPLRNLNSLRLIFNDISNIIFVDNEEVFKDALKKGSYKDYFTDMFAGDFGHCTRLGNSLIAKNAAKAIIKEYFSK